MSCAPTYSYRPTFEASNVSCSMPVYNTHRSRLFEGGTYFRSILQSESWNDITLSIHEGTTDPPESITGFILTVSHPSFPIEVYVVEQGPPPVITDPPADPPEMCTPGIADLRELVNTGSLLIEMPERGDDIEFDLDGEDDTCLSEFPPTLMEGGEGAPTDSAGLSSIRTGPERSVIRVATEEAYDGTPTDPPIERRVQQWNGTVWVEYSNNVPGACPT
jgi:hypothetical protein